MKARDLTDVLTNFSALPAEAIVPRKAAALILGMSERTLRRNPGMESIAISQRQVGYRAGDIRERMALSASQCHRISVRP
jgi:hypothetical protein